MPGDPTRALASMGNYVFTMSAMKEAIVRDAGMPASRHDLGRDIIPALVGQGGARVFDFARHRVPGQLARERGYWRDVGTIDAYFAANMDLVAVDPVFSLYNEEWPVLTWQLPRPPAKFVHEDGDRRGHAFNSLICGGTVVSGGVVRRSILSPGVRVHSHAVVEDSVLFDDVEIGAGAVVKRAIGFHAAATMTPQDGQSLIRARARAAIGRLRDFRPYRVTGPLTLDLTFKSYLPAEALALLPGAERVTAHAVRYRPATILDAIRFLQFTTSYRSDLTP